MVLGDSDSRVTEFRDSDTQWNELLLITTYVNPYGLSQFHNNLQHHSVPFPFGDRNNIYTRAPNTDLISPPFSPCVNPSICSSIMFISRFSKVLHLPAGHLRELLLQGQQGQQLLVLSYWYLEQQLSDSYIKILAQTSSPSQESFFNKKKITQEKDARLTSSSY